MGALKKRKVQQWIKGCLKMEDKLKGGKHLLRVVASREHIQISYPRYVVLDPRSYDGGKLGCVYEEETGNTERLKIVWGKNVFFFPL